MSKIKVGDEVLVRGTVVSVDIETEDRLYYGVEFGSGKPNTFTFVPRDHCQKKEPRFVITPGDVGRMAITYDGRKAFITTYYENQNQFAGCILTKGYCSFWANSGIEKEGRAHEDLVGWWEE